MPSFGRRLACHISTGTLVALGFGFALGLFLAVGLSGLEGVEPLVADWTRWVVLATLLGSIGAIAGFLCLLPFEFSLAALEKPRAFARRIRPGCFYLAICVAAAGFVHSAFLITFHWVRDVSSSKGMAAILAAAVLAALLPVAVAILTRRRSDAPSRRDSGRLFPLSLVLVGASMCIGWVAFRSLTSPPDASQTISPTCSPAPLPMLSDGTGKRPDVLLVSVDTLRADHLSCYGYNLPTTPNLDALAAQGAKFTHARSQAPWTLPSHASMMTGLYPSVHGARFYTNFRFLRAGISVRLGEDHVTLAEIVRSVGYQTSARTAVHWLGDDFGVVQGFDVLQAESRHTSAARSVDQTLEWLLQDCDQPRFVFLHFFDLHQYRSPASYEARFVDSEYRGVLYGRIRSVLANAYDHLSEADLSYAVGKYDAALAFVDAELGRLFAELGKAGRFDNTLIIVTSDHGEEFWDHGGTGHGFTLYEEQLRVPLIVKPPKSFPIRSRAPDVAAGLIDVAPTVLDYLNISSHKDRFQGESLRPYIETVAQPRIRPIFAEDTYFFNSYAVVVDEEKYIHNRIPPYELFNPELLLANVRAFYKFRDPEFYRLRTDPAEKENLAGTPAETTQGLVSQLWRHIEKTEVSEPHRVDEETVRELRSLGYVH